MCHEWWLRRMHEQREASRELWDEFEQTRPLTDPKETDEEVEVSLERTEPAPVAADR
jgi:hypothetical protein